MVVVKHLAAILKLMEVPRDLLLDLLDVICEQFPTFAARRVHQLQKVCPRHPDPHHVSPAGFLLLKEVEGDLGT